MTVRTLLAGTVAATSLAAGSQAAVDQSFEGPYGSGLYVRDFVDVAQTFTVGLTGQLTQVDVYIQVSFDATEDLTLSILETGLAGQPDDAAIPGATASLAAAAAPNFAEWVSFDLSSLSLQVTAGDVLALMLQSEVSGDGRYIWWAATNPNYTYPGGAAYNRTGLDWNREPDGDFFDVGFRTHVIPEPATLGPLALAAAFLAPRRGRARS